MHLHFEKADNTKSDCTILSLAWMGRIPDVLPEIEDWKLNKSNYYQDGWLAIGNVNGIVGVTFTSSQYKKNIDLPLCTNYNLRGHRSEVILVKWNESYHKLVTCDSSGIIFVWLKNEGRWTIERIDDYKTSCYFSWSHDGRMSLICYLDGFVSVGWIAGERIWSATLNIEGIITCGSWTPDDQQILVGTTSGELVRMDFNGTRISQYKLSTEYGITSMAWSCKKFNMEEDYNSRRKFILAVCLSNGTILLLKSIDDLPFVEIQTGLQGDVLMDWSNSCKLLAVAGFIEKSMDSNYTNEQTEYYNILKFYDDKGNIIYIKNIPYAQAPVSAMTWGHNDKRLFLSTGNVIHIAWVSSEIETLQLLCLSQIYDSIYCTTKLPDLMLPERIINKIENLFAQTIRSYIPDSNTIRNFVSRPPEGSIRLYCTLKKDDDGCYTLYLEYLGGLLPLLKAKPSSKIRQEFIIFEVFSSETKHTKSSSYLNSSRELKYKNNKGIEESIPSLVMQEQKK